MEGKEAKTTQFMEVRFSIGTKPTWFRDGPYQTGSIPFINTKVVD